MSTSRRFRNQQDEDWLRLSSFNQGDFITWQVNVDRVVNGENTTFTYDYGAIRSTRYDSASQGWYWHITGNGHHYGGPIVTDDQLIGILDSKETTGVWVRSAAWHRLIEAS